MANVSSVALLVVLPLSNAYPAIVLYSLLPVKLIKVHANLNYLTPSVATLGAIDISSQMASK